MAKYTLTNNELGARGTDFILLDPGETRSGVELTDEQAAHIAKAGILMIEKETIAGKAGAASAKA
ncbi:MAG: hypothetical protein EP345_17610 [Sphingomonadales bacterium]|nr:MAG: hypothetical protein EP345_17610 [Sphingomonadales bacterium]